MTWQTLSVYLPVQERQLDGLYYVYPVRPLAVLLSTTPVKKHWFHHESETALTVTCVYAVSCVQHVGLDIHWPRLIFLRCSGRHLGMYTWLVKPNRIRLT